MKRVNVIPLLALVGLFFAYEKCKEKCDADNKNSAPNRRPNDDGKKPRKPLLPLFPPRPVEPEPICPVPPPDKPDPGPWDDRKGPVGSSPVEGGKVSPDGTTEIAIDLPSSEKKRNVGGRDGSGLCVFTSIEYGGRWANERELFDFQKNMRSELGGGWPEKVDKMMKKYAPHVAYIQDTTGDYELIKAAIRSGRMPGVTYNGHDPHYRGSIAHMVALAHADDRWVCVSDNNYTQDNQFVWMSPADFKSRFNGGGGGWSVILLKPGPPPMPRNLAVTSSDK